MVRRTLAIVLGLAGGIAFIMAGIAISSMLFPPLRGSDLNRPEDLRAFIQSLPPAALLWVLAVHQGGSLLGGLAVALVARSAWLAGGAVVGAVFLAAGAMNLAAIPHPLWFAAADLALYLPMAILGSLAGGTWIGRPAPSAP